MKNNREKERGNHWGRSKEISPCEHDLSCCLQNLWDFKS
jgi:hypothetical protein